MVDDDTIDAPTLHALAALVREHTGIAMDERKRALLEGRIGPRVRELGLSGFAQYVSRVRQGGPEVQAFINMVTTNDTAFFRTPAVWQYLADEFLPQWHDKHPRQTLHVWSAAAASGEEAYSMAMLCQEFKQRHSEFRYMIDGTDIDTDMVAACRAARYTGRTARLLRERHPQRVARFFAIDGDALVAGPLLRESVQFSQHNLLLPAPGRTLHDLILLRNVLIYLDEATQRIVLTRARSAMALDGSLDRRRTGNPIAA